MQKAAPVPQNGLNTEVSQGLYYDSDRESGLKNGIIRRVIYHFLFERHATDDPQEKAVRETLPQEIISGLGGQYVKRETEETAEDFKDRQVAALVKVIRHLLAGSQTGPRHPEEQPDPNKITVTRFRIKLLRSLLAEPVGATQPADEKLQAPTSLNPSATQTGPVQAGMQGMLEE